MKKTMCFAAAALLLAGALAMYGGCGDPTHRDTGGHTIDPSGNQKEPPSGWLDDNFMMLGFSVRVRPEDAMRLWNMRDFPRLAAVSISAIYFEGFDAENNLYLRRFYLTVPRASDSPERWKETDKLCESLFVSHEVWEEGPHLRPDLKPVPNHTYREWVATEMAYDLMDKPGFTFVFKRGDEPVFLPITGDYEHVLVIEDLTKYTYSDPRIISVTYLGDRLEEAQALYDAMCMDERVSASTSYDGMDERETSSGFDR